MAYSKRALQDWEQGGRQPDSAARVYLTVIAKGRLCVDHKSGVGLRAYTGKLRSLLSTRSHPEAGRAASALGHGESPPVTPDVPQYQRSAFRYDRSL
jgi:hypothetical protein